MVGQLAYRLGFAGRGIRWMDELAENEPAKVGMTRIRAHSGLIPVGDGEGAILAWMFDMKPGASQMLLVRLTEDEADAVYSADPYTVGVLEPVRRGLANRWAVLAVRTGENLYTAPYRIPRRATEGSFIAKLDRIAATCPAFALDHKNAVVPRTRAFALEMTRDLAFA